LASAPVVDLVNPTDNKVIGKVTMADEIDTRKAIGAAKEAINTFSQTSKEYRMELLQRLHDAVANAARCLSAEERPTAPRILPGSSRSRMKAVTQGSSIVPGCLTASRRYAGDAATVR